MRYLREFVNHRREHGQMIRAGYKCNYFNLRGIIFYESKNKLYKSIILTILQQEVLGRYKIRDKNKWTDLDCL